MGKDLEKPERIRPPQAASITGLAVRTVQLMALRGEIPGAAKLGGSWTFDEATLRAWVAEQVKKTQFRASATRKAAFDGIDLEYEHAMRRLKGKPPLDDATLFETVKRAREVRAHREEQYRLGKRSRRW
jgi:predicted DNA-binding transcriptional regulator AlpA